MAQVRFSRHAKRRMQLYEITEDAVIGIFPPADTLGRHNTTGHSPDHKLPIKVVYEVHAQETVVITAYPLKKAKQ